MGECKPEGGVLKSMIVRLKNFFLDLLAPRKKDFSGGVEGPRPPAIGISSLPSYFVDYPQPEHILIQCKGCEQEECTVSCGNNAVAYILGDLLIEAVKCKDCGRNAVPIPACITDCRNSTEKLILDMIPVEEKRRAAAERCPC
jgi:hypothetical protein